jgi:hypothetical protein
MPTPFGTNAARDPYYAFNRFRQKPDFDWTTTPAIGGPAGYLEENRDAAFLRWLSNNLGVGVSDQSAWGQFARNQFQNAEAGFLAGLAEDPTLTFQSYLPKLSIPQIRMDFLRQSPRARGENFAQFGGPMRTIADI